VATLPAGIATELGDAFKLRSFAPPMRLPRIDVSQHWHERFHREPGSQWIRDVFAELFSAADDSEVQQSSR
jgi:DNA-binding transcriptional LysR family regulator